MNWKQKLLMARAKWFLKRYSAVRDFGLHAPAKYDDSTITGLRKCVFDWLKYNDHYVNTDKGNSKIIKAIIGADHVAICFPTKTKLSPSELKELQIIKLKCKVCYEVTDMQTFVDWYEEILTVAKSL